MHDTLCLPLKRYVLSTDFTRPITSFSDYQARRRELYVLSQAAKLRLEKALQAFQAECKHPKKIYCTDLSGGRDSYYRCLVCEKEL